ncbi:unnamed protein product, partial [Symbiodinium pilosum]
MDWWMARLQTAKAKAASSKPVVTTRPSALRTRPKASVATPAFDKSLVASGIDPDSAEAILAALGTGGAARQARLAGSHGGSAPSGPTLPVPAALDDGLGNEVGEPVVEEESQERGLADALLKLTAVLSELHPAKKPSGLEAVLGNLAVTASSSDSTGVSAARPSRKNAQARLALRTALRDQPLHFAAHVEAEVTRKVGEIVRAISVAGSATAVPYRTYMEHRAFVSGHRPTQQWLWILSGIGEALTAGRLEEARARVALGVVYGGQVCLDGGHSAMAGELLFED